MALETVFISTLLVAHLAEPPKLLQTLALDLVPDGFRRHWPGFRHRR